jgi:hypothetical protein
MNAKRMLANIMKIFVVKLQKDQKRGSKKNCNKNQGAVINWDI